MYTARPKAYISPIGSVRHLTANRPVATWAAFPPPQHKTVNSASLPLMAEKRG